MVDYLNKNLLPSLGNDVAFGVTWTGGTAIVNLISNNPAKIGAKVYTQIASFTTAAAILVDAGKSTLQSVWSAVVAGNNAGKEAQADQERQHNEAMWNNRGGHNK